MKTSVLPALRVSPETRREAEMLLREGESLSSFMSDALAQYIEFRKAQEDFIERGLASAREAKRTGEYVSSASVVRKLKARLRATEPRRR